VRGLLDEIHVEVDVRALHHAYRIHLSGYALYTSVLTTDARLARECDLAEAIVAAR
jgi:hypothetical protein